MNWCGSLTHVSSRVPGHGSGVSFSGMLLHVDVAVGLPAEVADPVIAEAGEESVAEMADSAHRFLLLANQRRSCIARAAGRSETHLCCPPLLAGRRDEW